MWPTPQRHDAQGPKTPEQIATMRAKGHGVKNLNEVVREYAAQGDANPFDAVNRVHRLKALGNGIVPAVAYIFAAAIYDVLDAERTAEMERAA